MSKNFLNDMVKVKHARTQSSNFISRQIEKEKIEIKEMQIKKGGRRWGLWFLAGVSVLFFLFALSYLFAKATVTVNPKIQDVTLNENLSASKDNTGFLPFDLVVISGEENKLVKTNSEKIVVEKATGVVIIYNDFSSTPQALSIDTRLEGSNGKIYKTLTKTVVPGKVSTGTPGSVEVKIYADVAGVESNSTPLDFTIVGFKSTPKYSKFYARSKGEISGGFKGTASVISDIEKTIVINNLKNILQTKLFKKVTDQTPRGFVLFKDAVFLNIDNNNNVDLASAKDGMVPVKLKGTLYGLLFDEAKLTKKIAESNIEKYDDSPVYIPNIRDLKFFLMNQENISFADVKNINFNLSGVTKIVWKTETDKLVKDLLAKHKKDFNEIVSKYSNIVSAKLALSPIWKMYLPDKTKDISVIVNYPK